MKSTIYGFLAAKKKDATSDTSEQEHEIDLVVYHHYGLSYEETKVIDATLTEKEFREK